MHGVSLEAQVGCNTSMICSLKRRFMNHGIFLCSRLGLKVNDRLDR